MFPHTTLCTTHVEPEFDRLRRVVKSCCCQIYLVYCNIKRHANNCGCATRSQRRHRGPGAAANHPGKWLENQCFMCVSLDKKRKNPLPPLLISQPLSNQPPPIAPHPALANLPPTLMISQSCPSSVSRPPPSPFSSSETATTIEFPCFCLELLVHCCGPANFCREGPPQRRPVDLVLPNGD